MSNVSRQNWLKDLEKEYNKRHQENMEVIKRRIPFFVEVGRIAIENEKRESNQIIGPMVVIEAEQYLNPMVNHNKLIATIPINSDKVCSG